MIDVAYMLYFFERMCHVKNVLPFYMLGKKTNWPDVAAEFVGS
jgi:hypothetical protein